MSTEDYLADERISRRAMVAAEDRGAKRIRA